MLSFRHIIETGLEKGADEVHVTAGAPIIYRIDNELVRADERTVLPNMVAALIDDFVPTAQAEILQEKGSCLFSYNLSGLGRLRMSISKQRGSHTLSIRIHKNLEEVLSTARFPEAVEKLYQITSGLIVLTGGGNSGRSTTALSLLNDINTYRACHIATVERPIEYLMRHKKSIVRQREVGMDTASYLSGLDDAINDGADVIFLDDVRDIETLKRIIQVADSGRLVVMVMNTPDATSTVQKVVNSFDQNERFYMKYQFASSLKAIVAHKMIRENDQKMPIHEILLGNRSIKRLIEEDKLRDINKVIAAHESMGMVTLQSAMERIIGEKSS